jgi:hypothetical protein
VPPSSRLPSPDPVVVTGELETARRFEGATVPAPTASRRRGRRRWWWEFGIAAGLYWLYEAIRTLVAGKLAGAQRDGHDLLHWEQVAHLNPEHWLNQALDRLPALAVPACYFYAIMYMVVTPGVLVWTYWRHPESYARHRTALLLITFAALIGFCWFPTAPPRLLNGAGFHDTMSLYHSWGWWGASTRAPAGTGTLANAYAAMPSLHVAWAAWCAATVCALVRRPVVRLAAVSYPIITALVVLGTANHYLLDALAGTLLWLVVHLTVARPHRRLAPGRRYRFRRVRSR